MSPRGLVGALLLVLGFSLGVNLGQWQTAIQTDRAVAAWREEARLRNQVAEEALQILAESKYQISAAKAEAGRKLRNVQDGRK